MSLIPSESLNFPDSFRAKVGWRTEENEDEAKALQALKEAVAKGLPATAPEQVEQLRPAEVHQVTPPQTAARAETEGVASPQEGDSPQDLIPNPPIHSPPAETLTSMAEMSALLSHFLASAAPTEVSTVLPNEQATTPPRETVAEPANLLVQPHKQPAPAPPEPIVSVPEPVTPAEKPATSDQSTALTGHPAVSPPRSISRNGFTILPEPPGSERAAPAPAPAAPVVNPEPAEVNLFNLIAAAVQRGALQGESVPQTEPALVQAPTAPVTSDPLQEIAQPSTLSTAAFEPALDVAPAATPSAVIFETSPGIAPASSPPSPAASQPLPEIAPVSTPSAVAAPAETVTPPVPAGAATLDLPRAPAKIRITPRKNIKPHVSGESVEQTTEQSSPEIEEIDSAPPEPIPAPWRLPLTQVVKKTAPIIHQPQEPLWEMEHFATPARRVAGARRGIDRPDTLLFTARERRNRLIGFGLSEAATLVALILLGRFAFVHRFPDPTMKVLMFILMLAAAAVAVALPIAFFGTIRRAGNENPNGLRFDGSKRPSHRSLLERHAAPAES